MAMRRSSVSVLAATLLTCIFAGCSPPKYEGVDTTLQGEDRDLINITVQTVLERNKIGEGSNWSNQRTKRRGTITPLRTFKSERNEDCRDYQQILSVDGRSYVTFDSACRQRDGRWKSLNYASASDAWAQYAFRDYDYPYYRYGHHGYPYRYGYGYSPFYGYGHGYGPSYGSGVSIGFGGRFH